MDVLTIERGHEATVDARIDLMRELIGLVLNGLDRFDELLKSLGLLEQLMQQFRRAGKMPRELVEQREELLIPRNESAEHSGWAPGCGSGRLCLPAAHQSSSPRGQSAKPLLQRGYIESRAG